MNGINVINVINGEFIGLWNLRLTKQHSHAL